MSKYRTTILALALLAQVFGSTVFAQALNPEEINPHAKRPRARITLEQKEAAARARKEKKKELADRKAATADGQEKQGRDSVSSGAVKDSSK